MYNWGAKKIGYPTGSRPPAILITRFFLRLSQLKYKNYTLFSKVLMDFVFDHLHGSEVKTVPV